MNSDRLLHIGLAHTDPNFTHGDVGEGDPVLASLFGRAASLGNQVQVFSDLQPSAGSLAASFTGEPLPAL
ncbi:MAG: hypothetical protein NT154_21950, partial [Verrucomicrobia bacterium]|nr:hypothetical protein [Verrucomicrobiota bacterium]